MFLAGGYPDTPKFRAGGEDGVPSPLKHISKILKKNSEKIWRIYLL